jgi:hypothetical protein
MAPLFEMGFRRPSVRIAPPRPSSQVSTGPGGNAGADLERQIDGLLSHSLEVSDAGGWPSGIRDWFSIL